MLWSISLLPKQQKNGIFLSAAYETTALEDVYRVRSSPEKPGIPVIAEKPDRVKRKDAAPATLLEILKEERSAKRTGGIYHKIQVDLTYNSNHMEGSRLTHDQTRYIYETNTIGFTGESVSVDDVIETANHFRCLDLVIDAAKAPLTEKFIKELHTTPKSRHLRQPSKLVCRGRLQKMPNEAGGMETTLPEDVAGRMRDLLAEHNSCYAKALHDLMDFHVRFERIHPFQGGSGRVGRLILFKECLKYGIVPFIIEDDLKLFYYCGLKE